MVMMVMVMYITRWNDRSREMERGVTKGKRVNVPNGDKQTNRQTERKTDDGSDCTMIDRLIAPAVHFGVSYYGGFGFWMGVR